MISKLALFPVTAEINHSGRLAVGGVDVTELAERYGTPLYVFDEATIRARCRDFKREFSGRYQNTTAVYAGKAFLHGALAAVLNEEGFGLDVVSAGEIHIAESGGFPSERIYFHGNNKSVDELKMALERRIGHIVVDNEYELELLAGLAAESGYIPQILLRITPGVDAHTHGHLTTGTVGSKFGIPLHRARAVIARAMAITSLELVGLHCHIGSMIDDVGPYLEAIDLMLGLAAEAGRECGFKLKELDIGGGFGVRYILGAQVPDIGLFAEGIVGRLSARCQDLEVPLPTLVIEPGRSIIAQAGFALYRAGAVKEVDGHSYVAVDGGMTDNIRPALYDAHYEALSAGKAEVPESERVTIVGRNCESGDILIKQTMMAPVATGDLVAIPVCGAYCLPMSSNYNGVLKPAVVMVKDGASRLIRHRETLQDLTRGDVV